MKSFNDLDRIPKAAAERNLPRIERREKETKKLLSDLANLISNSGGPEEFFVVEQYESLGQFEKIVAQLAQLAFEAILDKKFDEVISISQQTLELSGITVAKNVSAQSPNAVIALAEAINWAAKVISYTFYSLKPLMIVAASQTPGVFFGYNDDGTYSLGSPTIGIASFHDPSDEVGHILINLFKQEIPEWEFAWSGISRREDAFKILEDLSSGKGLVKTYSDLTSPEELKKAREKYLEGNFHDRLITLGELFKSKN